MISVASVNVTEVHPDISKIIIEHRHVDSHLAAGDIIFKDYSQLVACADGKCANLLKVSATVNRDRLAK